MALYIDIGLNDELVLDENTTIVLERKSGSRARLRINGDSRVVLKRAGRPSLPPAVRGAETPPRANTGD